MTEHSPEIKATGTEVAQAFDEFARAFETFRETNDDRLQQIERRMGGDVVTEEKLARIDRGLDEAKAKLDQLSLKARRPQLEASDEHKAIRPSPHQTAFRTYMRTGEATVLKDIEEKALSAGSGPDGGYLVPMDAEREILRRMTALSPIRALATVREIAGGQLKKAYAASGPVAGWTAETALPGQTATPVLADLTFPAMELYAMPSATQTLLDDAAVDVEQWIAEEVQASFAEKETQAFIGGDGVNKPKGFLSYPTIVNANWSWGNIGTVLTGVDGGFAAANGSDALVNLVYAVKGGYRQNGTFVMNRQTQAAVRRMKDAQGQYLWQPPSSIGAQATLMSFPVVEAEDMPAMATDSLSIAFGDFRRGYLVVDRMGVRVLRDPYSAKPYVLFYTTKRVGGGVQDFDAIKLLKFADA
jgi:HK97 family phage major capsid protein